MSASAGQAAKAACPAFTKKYDMVNKHSNLSAYDARVQSYIQIHLNETILTHLKKSKQGIINAIHHIYMSEYLVKKSKMLLKDK